MKSFKFLHLASLLVSMTGPGLFAESGEAPAESLIRGLSGELEMFSASKPAIISESWQAYQNFYGFAVAEPVLFCAGWVDSPPYRIALQAYIPDESRGTVFLVHGYFDHTGLQMPLIISLLGKKYTIVSLDLPGHGLSDGRRAEIGDFAEYGAAVTAVVKACTEALPVPFYAVGHSTGSSSLIEYLQNGGAGFEKMAFLSPLVRSTQWFPSKLGYCLGKSWLVSTRRNYRSARTNEGYEAFQKNDPLGCDRFPVSWSKAFFAWEKRVGGYRFESPALLIIQGTKDGVVDYRYNVPFLIKKMSARVEYVEGGGHLLIHEDPLQAERVFELIDSFFSGKP